MRWPRDFRRGRLYGVTQRGNNGQWIYIDKQDFLWALAAFDHPAWPTSIV